MDDSLFTLVVIEQHVIFILYYNISPFKTEMTERFIYV
jgi:hypothetical protein